MRQKSIVKIFSLTLFLLFFISTSSAFAAPAAICNKAPEFSLGSTKITATIKSSAYTDWDTYEIVLRTSATSGLPISPYKTVVLGTMTRDDAVFSFNTDPQTSYKAFIRQKNTNTSPLEISSCSFTTPPLALTPPSSGTIISTGATQNPIAPASTNPPTQNPIAPSAADQKKAAEAAAAAKAKEVAGSGKIDLHIDNPLGVTSINEVIAKIMNVIVKLAIPVIICFFIYAGFMFITAQGDKTKLATAKNMFLQVIVGSIIILGAWTIATAIVNTVNLITG